MPTRKVIPITIRDKEFKNEMCGKPQKSGMFKRQERQKTSQKIAIAKRLLRFSKHQQRKVLILSNWRWVCWKNMNFVPNTTWLGQTRRWTPKNKKTKTLSRKISIAVHITRSTKLWKQKVVVNGTILFLRKQFERGVTRKQTKSLLCKFNWYAGYEK